MKNRVREPDKHAMTATEAASSPRVVGIIAKAARADKRTVLSCLRGESPYSVIWWRIHDAATAAGVDALPEPRRRAPRASRTPDCAACAKLLEAEAEVTRLRALLAAPEPPAPVNLEPPPPQAPTPPVVALPKQPRPALQRVRLVEEGPDGQDLPVHVA